MDWPYDTMLHMLEHFEDIQIIYTAGNYIYNMLASTSNHIGHLFSRTGHLVSLGFILPDHGLDCSSINFVKLRRADVPLVIYMSGT